MTAPKVSQVRYCAYCSTGNHTRCTGTTSTGGECQCGGRAHDPSVDVAAEMRLYLRFDEAALSVEERATRWRKATGGVR